MRYHIDTIPVLDALKSGAFCPFCALEKDVAAKRVDFYLGGSVMEPDVRIRVNQKGFCADHQRVLYKQKNKLGHALMMLSHVDQILEQLNAIDMEKGNTAKKRFFLKNAAAETENDLPLPFKDCAQRCILCEDIAETMDSYYHTFLHLWHTDKELPGLITSNGGLCLQHTAAVMSLSKRGLSADEASALNKLLYELLKQRLHQTRDDLEYFTCKFDYRNADKPWGNSKDGLERTIRLLEGDCL